MSYDWNHLDAAAVSALTVEHFRIYHYHSKAVGISTPPPPTHPPYVMSELDDISVLD